MIRLTIVSLAMVCVLTGSVRAARPHGATLAKYLPDDVGLFLQVNNLALLCEELQAGPMIRDFLEASGAPAASGLQPIEVAVRGTLGLDWMRAQRYLFSGEAAVAAPGVQLADLQQMVLLVSLPSQRVIGQAVREMGAVEQPGGVADCRLYMLPNGLQVAACGPFLLFGSRIEGTPTCLFDRICANLSSPREQTGRLAYAPTFSRHFEQLACKKRGVLFVDYARKAASDVESPSAASQPVPWLVWPGVQDFMAGLTVEAQAVTWELIATRSDWLRSAQNPVSTLPIAELPADTLLAWSGRVDAHRLFYRLLDDPERADFRQYLWLAQWVVGHDDLDLLLQSLGPQFVLVVGTLEDRPPDLDAGLQLPAISLMVQVQNREIVQTRFERWAEGMSMLLNTLAVPLVGCRPLHVAHDQHRDQAVRKLSLSGLLCERTRCPFLQTLQLAWTVQDDWLIVSSHPQHLEQLLDARAGHSRQLRERIELTDGCPDAGSRMVVMAQPRQAALMVQTWLDYLAAEMPETLQPGWWQRRSASSPAPATVLGADLKPVSGPPGHLLVTNVRPDCPASGRLRDGDVIIAVEHQRLHPHEAMEQVQEAIARSRGAVVMTIKRGADDLDVLIRLPVERTRPTTGGDPIVALRQVAALGQYVEGFRFTLHPTPPQELHASGSLQLPSGRRSSPVWPIPLDR